MTLAEELRADQDPRSRCALCAFIESNSDDVQAEWDAVLADRAAYTHASVYRALQRRGVKVGRSTVDTHRASRHRARGVS